MKKIVFLLLSIVLCLSFAGQIVGAQENVTLEPLYPEDLFASAQRFGEYFAHGENAVFQEENGEQIFYVPNSDNTGFQYTLSSIPYTTYTLHYEAALILYTEETTGMSHGEEACMLFGLRQGEQLFFHQIRLFNSNGMLLIDHWKFENGGWQAYAEEDTLLMVDLDAQDIYFDVTMQVENNSVDVYIDGEFAVTIANIADSAGGDSGVLAFRSSGEGFKMKNFNVYEGIIDPENLIQPESTPTLQPTQTATPTNTPEIPTNTPTTEPTEQIASPTPNPETGNGKTADIITIIVISVILVAAAGTGLGIYIKKKR